MARDRDDLPRARALLDEARSHHRRVGDEQGTAAIDAYLGVLALEVPTSSATTTMKRTGTAARIVVHGKVGRVTSSRVGFVSVRWVRSPLDGPVIGNVYERFSFRASAALRATKSRASRYASRSHAPFVSHPKSTAHC
jgi:hypothetical protein